MMTIDSPAFVHEQQIPERYTCKGKDVSPPLTFHDIPKDAQSLVLIVDDPDAPSGTFVHWVAFNIPPQTSSLSEGGKVPNQGKNSFKVNKYRGPCPPPGGPHRYYFKLYALNIKLELEDGTTKEQVLRAIEGHVIAQAQLMGTFQS